MDLGQEYHYYGDFVTGAAGDWPTLAFAVTEVALVAGDEGCDTGEGGCCLLYESTAKCVFRVERGSVFRTVGSRAVRLRPAPPAALLAVDRQRVALAPAYRGRTFSAQPHAAAGGEIQLRDAQTGALQLSLRPRGVARAVALSGETLAVLMQDGRKKRIDRFDVRSGRRVGSTAVPRTTAYELDADAGYAVYRHDLEIRALQLRTGRSRLLGRASATPIGLSIEGKRVAWAENRRGRGRILALSF